MKKIWYQGSYEKLLCCCFAATAAAACVCGGCQSTTPGRVVQCAPRGACCKVRVWLVHPPQSPGYYTTVAMSLKQTKHRGTASAAVDKAHYAVIDIAAAPCQSSRMCPHALVGLLGDLASTRPCHMGGAFVRDI